MAEAQDRREAILAAAADLFARKGLRATTVRGIAEAVGMFSGSLYHHFPSKDAIVDELLTRYLDAIRLRYAVVTASGKAPTECLHDLVVTSLEVAEQQPDATAIYQNETQYLREIPGFRHIQTSATEIQRTWLDVIQKGVADGSFRADIPPRVFYRMIRDAVWLATRWHRPDGSYSTRQLAEDLTVVFLHGFAASSSSKAEAPRTAKKPTVTARAARDGAGTA
jgi:AcrR family transcriptional regulator